MRRMPLLLLLGAVACDDSTTWEPPEVFINEFVASNASGLTDASGAYPDWIEIWNGSDALVDLSPYTLTDDATQPQKWPFPAGVELEAGGYLVIYADGDPSTVDELHTTFVLDAQGEEILLIGPATADLPVVDAITYDEQQTDVAMARQPDGGEWGTDDSPTPGASNE